MVLLQLFLIGGLTQALQPTRRRRKLKAKRRNVFNPFGGF